MANVAIHSGKFIEVDDDNEVDYELATYDRMFGSHINAIPVQSAVQGPRLFYGARFENQALPLKDAEVPLVQNQDQDTGLSFDKLYGKYAGALEADDDYTVEKVDLDQMVLRNKAGAKVIKELYNNTPFNRKTSLNNTSLVKAGDKVTKGQILAKSNYTDDSGTLAMGKNALVGLIAYKGHSMDDAIVISQGFANKLTSEHSETHALDIDHNIKLNKNHFKSLFPENFNKEQLEKMDDDGVIKPGMILNEGDPIFLTTKPRTINSSSFTSGKLTKGLAQAREDASQKWSSAYPAEVVDVYKGRKGVKVLTKAYAPSKIGDKIVFRTGQKSIISEILPDELMPKTESGETLEVLLNQLSLPSRTNVSLPYELALGKAAHKLGKPIVLPGFTKKGENWRDIIKGKLSEAGVDLKEKIYDPKEDRLLEDPVTVGRGYIMKLHHTAACYDEQTEVLTQEGWKFWKDVTMDDELATSDTRGQKLLFEKPLHLFSYTYNGLLCAYSGKYVDYAVTPNHNMWQKNYYGPGNFSFRQASELHGSRFAIKQFGLDPAYVKPEPTIKIGTLTLDWDDFCELVGWWVTEGCVTTSKCGIVIYQSQSANPEKVQRIEDLINRMGVRWSYFKAYGEIMGFSINEKSLADYFSNYGGHSQFKRVPRELIKGSISGCKRLLESIILGDGNKQETPTGPKVRLTSTSKQLADDFQELCIRVGEGSIVRKASRDTKKYIDNPHYLDHWVCSRTSIRKASQVDGDRNGEGFAWVPYSGKVYCAEMNSGLLYVRRNGKPMLCGNSKTSARGQGSYDQFQQPTKGGGDSAQSKRLSGLETNVMLSSGAYNNIREASILRGQQNDDYWRQLKMGLNPRPPGIPFAWDKFNKMMAGAGINPKSEKGGVIRLTPMTDAVLNSYRPIELKNAELINMKDLSPVNGGLFDPALVSANAWGKITLPRPLPNPAYEKSIRTILGLKKSEFEEILKGNKTIKFKNRKNLN